MIENWYFQLLKNGSLLFPILSRVLLVLIRNCPSPRWIAKLSLKNRFSLSKFSLLTNVTDRSRDPCFPDQN